MKEVPEEKLIHLTDLQRINILPKLLITLTLYTKNGEYSEFKGLKVGAKRLVLKFKYSSH